MMRSQRSAWLGAPVRKCAADGQAVASVSCVRRRVISIVAPGVIGWTSAPPAAEVFFSFGRARFSRPFIRGQFLAATCGDE